MSGVPGAGVPPEEFDLGEVEEIEGDPGDATEPVEGEGAADGADDAEGDAGGEEGEDEVGEAPRRGRGSDTIRTLRRRAQEAERERDELRRFREDSDRRIRDIEQRVAQDPQAQARAAQQEQELLDRMSPAEAVQYALQKGRNEFQQALQMQEFRAQERFDKQAYDSEARTSKMHQTYRERVEQTLAAERARGNVGITRDVILKYLVGEDAMRRAQSAAPAQRRQAGSRVAGQQARPTGARSDGAAARRPAADSYEAALERTKNQPIW